MDVAQARDEENKLLVLGEDYKMAKSTKVFAYYSAADKNHHFDDDEAEFLSLNERTFAVGMEYKFWLFCFMKKTKPKF